MNTFIREYCDLLYICSILIAANMAIQMIWTLMAWRLVFLSSLLQEGETFTTTSFCFILHCIAGNVLPVRYDVIFNIVYYNKR